MTNQSRMRKLVDKALEYSSEKHKGQLDDQGRPYFYAHVVQVYGILNEITSDEETLCAGLLHDILEDTAVEYEELVHEFNKEIADIVLELTHHGNHDVGFYFPNLHSRKAVLIKFADRLSNLSRMDEWPGDRQEQYLNISRFWPTEPPGDKIVSPNL